MKVIHRVILHSIGYFLHITDIGIRTVYRKETVPMDGIGITMLPYSIFPEKNRKMQKFKKIWTGKTRI